MTTKSEIKPFASAASPKTLAEYLLPGKTRNNWPKPFFRSLLYVVGIMLVGSQFTFATTWYVTPGGSDSNACTQAEPCAHPDYAANNVASPGDTVSAAAGTYDYGQGALVITNSGTTTNYISIICASRGQCKIENGVSGNMTVVTLAGSYLTFTGFEVTNYSTEGNNLAFFVTGSNIEINENTIQHIETDCSDLGGGGIQLYGESSFITMDSNLVYDIGWPSGGNPKCGSGVVQFDGILAETDGPGIIISNNIVCHVSGGWGIACGNSSSDRSAPLLIANNTIFSTANGGIVLPHGSEGSVVINNIILNAGLVSRQCGVVYDTRVKYTIGHNDLYGNYGGNYSPLWGGSHRIGGPVRRSDIGIDPSQGATFVNWQADGSGDYHEKAGSPTIGAGTDDCGTGNPFPICAPSYDFDGNERGINGSYDIGAYQYHSTSSPTITTASPLPAGTVGAAYSEQLTATGGTTPYTWSVTACSGACDTGLGFMSGGLLNGAPANAGTSTFTFKVTDANNNTATANLSITINR